MHPLPFQLITKTACFLYPLKINKKGDEIRKLQTEMQKDAAEAATAAAAAAQA